MKTSNKNKYLEILSRILNGIVYIVFERGGVFLTFTIMGICILLTSVIPQITYKGTAELPL